MNPCETCLVSICCTQLCDEKKEYTEQIQQIFESFCKLHIYDEKSQRKKVTDPEIKEKYVGLVTKCKKNTKEVKTIFDRACILQLPENPCKDIHHGKSMQDMHSKGELH
jgi:hypothetical protein